MSFGTSSVDARKASVVGNNLISTPQSCPPQGCSPQNYPPLEYPPQGYEVLSSPIRGFSSHNCPMAVVLVQPEPIYGIHQTAVECQCCGAQVVTETTYRGGLFTWLLVLILFMGGCMVGCCLIPFCIKDTKDVVHSCPNCHREIGRWDRL